MRYFAWVDPADSKSRPRVSIVGERTAIQMSKDAAAKHNYTYESDEDALTDFLAVYWAWEVKPDATVESLFR